MSDYSFSEKLLHQVALGSNIIKQMSFDFEKLINRGKVKNDADPVFINGLARSGTTILMRTFNDTGHFRSLNYRDMPFVLMPSVWKTISQLSHQNMEETERSHGDGIFVNYDSPEAFEEIFWLTFCETEYVFKDRLTPHSVSNEIIEQFKTFINHILSVSCDFLENNPRYLSKNNNNILRLSGIRKAFPSALIIIPFRDPLQQAISLLNQHLLFSKQHQTDKFSCNYMNWLGHFEFGENHKPFCFSDQNSRPSNYETNDINYWLETWIKTYRFLLETADDDMNFIAFEALCKSPEIILDQLFKKVGVDFDVSDLKEKIKLPKNKNVTSADDNLISEANVIYRDLLVVVSKNYGL